MIRPDVLNAIEYFPVITVPGGGGNNNHNYFFEMSVFSSGCRNRNNSLGEGGLGLGLGSGFVNYG